MDGRIIDFLKAHNLLPIQECFEGFDFKTFKELEPNNLRDLVAKTSYRVLLEIKLKSLKNSNDEETETSLSDFNCADGDVRDENEEIDFIDVERLETGSVSNIEEDGNHQVTKIQSDAPPTIPASTVLSDVFKAIDDYDMDILQNKCRKLGYIDAKDRRRLSHCVIKFQLKRSKTKTLSRKTFLETANAITQIFPKEKASVYFIPSLGKIAAKGRLYQAYKTYRDLLATAGMIEKRHLSAKYELDEEEIEDKRSEANDVDKPLVTGVESLEFLKTHTDSNDDIDFHWSNSRKERFHLLNEVDIAEYYQTFPILTMLNGFSWLNLDFLQKFPDAKIGVDRWNEILPKLLLYA